MSDTDSTTSNWSASASRAGRSRKGGSRARGGDTQATAPRTMHLRPASSRHMPGRYREDEVYPLDRPSAVHPDPVFNPVLARFIAPGSLPMDYPGPWPSRVLYNQWLDDRGLTHAEHIEMLRNGQGLTRDSIPPLRRSRQATYRDDGDGQAQRSGIQPINNNNIVPWRYAGRDRLLAMDGTMGPALPWDGLPNGAKWLILKTATDTTDLFTAVKSLHLDLVQVLAFKKLYDREEQAWQEFCARRHHDHHYSLRLCTSSVDDLDIKKGVSFLNSITEVGWAKTISQLQGRYEGFLPIDGMENLSVEALQQAVSSGIRQDYHGLTPGALDWLRGDWAQPQEELVDMEIPRLGAQLDAIQGPVNEHDGHEAEDQDVLMSDPFVDFPQSADPPRRQPEALEGSIDGLAINDGLAIANYGPGEPQQEPREPINELSEIMAGMPAHQPNLAQHRSGFGPPIPIQMIPTNGAAADDSADVQEKDWKALVNLPDDDDDEPVADRGEEGPGDHHGGLDFDPIPHDILNLLPDTDDTASVQEPGDSRMRYLLDDLEQSARGNSNIELAMTGRATFGDQFDLAHVYPPFMDFTRMIVPDLSGELVQERQQQQPQQRSQARLVRTAGGPVTPLDRGSNAVENNEAAMSVDERPQQRVVEPVPRSSATNGDDALRDSAGDPPPPPAVPTAESTCSHRVPGAAASRKRKEVEESPTAPRKRVAKEAPSSLSQHQGGGAAALSVTPSTGALVPPTSTTPTADLIIAGSVAPSSEASLPAGNAASVANWSQAQDSCLPFQWDQHFEAPGSLLRRHFSPSLTAQQQSQSPSNEKGGPRKDASSKKPAAGDQAGTNKAEEQQGRQQEADAPLTTATTRAGYTGSPVPPSKARSVPDSDPAALAVSPSRPPASAADPQPSQPAE
ncbi:hypothetical protein M406DRAFT_327908 [Cryphonectria parasitica EP155]|uniref:Uncharacterized protein n=1 Tax=Cryphonectria parasitica (strain ATCC 38755 / EP155) TaxID=660469 RepID=A0A9P5CR66_CRYP1|nr:uncharacterized protein M406DRAFT_327908 [Cryphonectria parasitica EP155]KAF3766790.1 hypothetical protein M406DRAFT_327908 [Cryphonectria parasitica EP155]